MNLIAGYRLESDTDGTVQIVRDDERGDDYLYVLFQALRHYALMAIDNQRRTERLLDDIQDEIRRRRANNR